MIKTDFQRIADSYSIGTVTSASSIKKPIKVKTSRESPLTRDNEVVTGWLSLFDLRTNQGFYVLVGTTPNILTQNDIELRLQKELDLTYFEYLTGHNNGPMTHKEDLHWYLLQPFKTLSRAVAIEKISTQIRRQEINIQIGYGGVLFVGVGKPIEPKITRGPGEFYREMEFFVDEWWELLHDGKKVAILHEVIVENS